MFLGKQAPRCTTSLTDQYLCKFYDSNSNNFELRASKHENGRTHEQARIYLNAPPHCRAQKHHRPQRVFKAILKNFLYNNNFTEKKDFIRILIKFVLSDSLK
jgi:hypothetical protein